MKERSNEVYEIHWNLQWTRFIACCLMHYQFGDEISNALKLLKYVGLNHNNFERPMHAYLAALCQIVGTLLIEVANFWNLLSWDDHISIIMNFLALTVLTGFDDNFITPFMQTNLKRFAGMSIPNR